MDRWALDEREAQGETIFALSSGVGRAGVAVFRVSGPRSRFVLETLTGRKPRSRPQLCAVRSVDGGSIDQALVLSFEAPKSFTGEDVIEFHTHGGRAVTAAMLKALGAIEGCRLAEPGEFTLRAFQNGKISLEGSEALIDLIDAETEQQRRMALAHRHALPAELGRLRDRLIGAMGLLEAEIDFSDEGDTAAATHGTAAAIDEVATRLRQLIAASGRAERLRQGVKVVLAGEPNVGKSSLFNALAKRDVAIVSPQPGTTRDRLEVHLDLNGWPVTLVDTAGLREAADAVEAIGIARAADAIDSANIILHLSNRDEWPDLRSSSSVIRVRSQIDSCPIRFEKVNSIGVSSVTGAGLDALLEAIERAAATVAAVGEDELVANARQLRSLQRALCAIERVKGTVAIAEVAVEELRVAADELAGLLGGIDSEAVLSEVFARFCIGK